MSDVVSEAVDVVVPLISMGAGAAARDIAERGGAQLADSVTEILARLRARLTGRAPVKAEVESALRSAIAEGQISSEDLEVLVSLSHTVGGTHIHGDVKNAFIDSDINITGDFHA